MDFKKFLAHPIEFTVCHYVVMAWIHNGLLKRLHYACHMNKMKILDSESMSMGLCHPTPTSAPSIGNPL